MRRSRFRCGKCTLIDTDWLLVCVFLVQQTRVPVKTLPELLSAGAAPRKARHPQFTLAGPALELHMAGELLSILTASTSCMLPTRVRPACVRHSQRSIQMLFDSVRTMLDHQSGLCAARHNANALAQFCDVPTFREAGCRISATHLVR